MGIIVYMPIYKLYHKDVLIGNIETDEDTAYKIHHIDGLRLDRPSAESERIIVYTDGAYKPSTDQGGWAYVVTGKYETEEYGGKENTTNNQMELLAVIKALYYFSKQNNASERTIIIVTDSQYVYGCAVKGWKRNKNTKYWIIYEELLKKLKLQLTNVEFQWTKGHDGNPGNERADTLAVRGSNLLL